MSALLESLAAGFDSLPARDAAGLGDARRSALAAARQSGLPAPRTEAWKYTSLRALERREFAAIDALPQLDVDALDLPVGPRIVFANGRFHAGLSDLSALPDGVSLQPLSLALAQDDARQLSFMARRYDGAADAFARLNAAMAAEGALLRIEAGVECSVPIHWVLLGAEAPADSAWHLRNLVELRRGARLTLVEHRRAASMHSHLMNEITHVHLDAGAQLDHARVQQESDGATLLLRTDAVLARDTHYRRLDLELGAALSRHEFNVQLQGEGARVSANGVLLAGGRRHLDTRLGIDHAAPNTACQLVWRGLGAGRGRGVFHGGILIRKGADGSDAMLSNKNLLLNEGAEIDTQPVLEIHADEVKAAHGATVGRIDEAALFYLRSRGLPQDEARSMLTAAFCREVIDVIADAGVVALLGERLDHALAQLESK